MPADQTREEKLQNELLTKKTATENAEAHLRQLLTITRKLQQIAEKLDKVKEKEALQNIENQLKNI